MAMHHTRHANAHWEGTLKDGGGSLKLESGVYEGPYNWAGRFADDCNPTFGCCDIYGNAGGDWIDEDSNCRPTRDAGKAMLADESKKGIIFTLLFF